MRSLLCRRRKTSKKMQMRMRFGCACTPLLRFNCRPGPSSQEQELNLHPTRSHWANHLQGCLIEIRPIPLKPLLVVSDLRLASCHPCEYRDFRRDLPRCEFQLLHVAALWDELVHRGRGNQRNRTNSAGDGSGYNETWGNRLTPPGCSFPAQEGS